MRLIIDCFIKIIFLFSLFQNQRESIVPSLNVPVVKVQQCDEEFDETSREAKFAFRKTDLKSWKNSSGGTNTNSDSAPIQHWAVVIHFPRGNSTYVFEAYEDEKTGKLEGYRARHVHYEVFEKAKEFGTADTSPRELLEIAKQVQSNGTEYNPIDNNCQTWLKEFLRNISQNLCQSFERLLVELNLPIIVGSFLFLIVLVSCIFYSIL